MPDAATLRFRFALIVDPIVATLRGDRAAGFHCRPLADWIHVLETLGFEVMATPMCAGSPFANVLLVARYDSDSDYEASVDLCIHDDELPRRGARSVSRGASGDV